MAGTVVNTERTHTSVKLIKFDWLSDGAGAADSTTTEYYDGKVLAVVTVPGAGAAAPDPNYDVTIVDALGRDILLGNGMNRHTANTEFIALASLGAVSLSTLTLSVTAAGAANEGDIYVYIR
jgi:hypothetical protein